jgi:hypothetical protein
MKFLLGGDNVNPRKNKKIKKSRLLKLKTNYMRNKSEEIHAYG